MSAARGRRPQEIRRVGSDPDACDAYRVPRRNYVFGRWIRHSGYFPDFRQPQLFRRGRLRYTQDAVHETYVLDGSLGTLREPIAQVPFRDLAQMLHKMQRYSNPGRGATEPARGNSVHVARAVAMARPPFSDITCCGSGCWTAGPDL